MRFARWELAVRHLDQQLAEDLVGDAIVRWLTARIHNQSQRLVRAWLRTTIRRMVVDRIRKPSADVLDLADVFSLNEPWARGVCERQRVEPSNKRGRAG